MVNAATATNGVRFLVPPHDLPDAEILDDGKLIRRMGPKCKVYLDQRMRIGDSISLQVEESRSDKTNSFTFGITTCDHQKVPAGDSQANTACSPYSCPSNKSAIIHVSKKAVVCFKRMSGERFHITYKPNPWLHHMLDSVSVTPYVILQTNASSLSIVHPLDLAVSSLPPTIPQQSMPEILPQTPSYRFLPRICPDASILYVDRPLTSEPLNIKITREPGFDFTFTFGVTTCNNNTVARLSHHAVSMCSAETPCKGNSIHRQIQVPDPDEMVLSFCREGNLLHMKYLPDSYHPMNWERDIGEIFDGKKAFPFIHLFGKVADVSIIAASVPHPLQTPGVPRSTAMTSASIP